MQGYSNSFSSFSTGLLSSNTNKFGTTSDQNPPWAVNGPTQQSDPEAPWNTRAPALGNWNNYQSTNTSQSVHKFTTGLTPGALQNTQPVHGLKAASGDTIFPSNPPMAGNSWGIAGPSSTSNGWCASASNNNQEINQISFSSPTFFGQTLPRTQRRRHRLRTTIRFKTRQTQIHFLHRRTLVLNLALKLLQEQSHWRRMEISHHSPLQRHSPLPTLYGANQKQPTINFRRQQKPPMQMYGRTTQPILKSNSLSQISRSCPPEMIPRLHRRV